MPDQDHIQTGDISRWFGFIVSEEMMVKIGHPPSGNDKRAKLWPKTEWPSICQSMARHCLNQLETEMPARPDKPPTKKEREAAEINNKPAAAKATAAAISTKYDLDDI